jgi:retinol dehydrogenase-14
VTAPSDRPLAGRIVVLTGASSGIGRAAALAWAKQGARLRLVGRDPTKLDDVVGAARAFGAEAVGLRGDFEDLRSVRELAEALLAREEPLHVLVNNAGAWYAEPRRSKDGYEATFAVNHLAPFLLTQRLLPRLRASDGDRRIVHVGSRVHLQAGQTTTPIGRVVHLLNILGVPAGARGARLAIESFDGIHSDDSIDRRAQYRGLEAYAQSKLAQLVYAFELARQEPAIASNVVHPGSVATEVTRDSRLLTAVMPVARWVLKTPEQGAATLTHAASDPRLRGVTGRYFARCREARCAEIAHDRALAAEVWAHSESLVARALVAR